MARCARGAIPAAVPRVLPRTLALSMKFPAAMLATWVPCPAVSTAEAFGDALNPRAAMILLLHETPLATEQFPRQLGGGSGMSESPNEGCVGWIPVSRIPITTPWPKLASAYVAPLRWVRPMNWGVYVVRSGWTWSTLAWTNPGFDSMALTSAGVSRAANPLMTSRWRPRWVFFLDQRGNAGHVRGRHRRAALEIECPYGKPGGIGTSGFKIPPFEGGGPREEKATTAGDGRLPYVMARCARGAIPVAVPKARPRTLALSREFPAAVLATWVPCPSVSSAVASTELLNPRAAMILLLHQTPLAKEQFPRQLGGGGGIPAGSNEGCVGWIPVSRIPITTPCPKPALAHAALFCWVRPMNSGVYVVRSGWTWSTRAWTNPGFDSMSATSAGVSRAANPLMTSR
ncbi:hypothetical protein ACMD2_04115 [Ananas comosus]|uniref:Uncharacterized protein n=1 Tax=Ananas comosus TaxID=4615 RepID=A0A199W835_ANACO|nr:hypothetical protein ACMD2_04115 [Ananas comosus]